MRAKIRLGQLLAKEINGTSLLRALESISPPITILGSRNEVLLGAPMNDALPRHPILFEEEPIGRVVGHEQAEWVAAFLTQVAYRELEVNDLADDMLELYREINLLYNLSEKLGASLDPQTVMKVVLEEASRLIDATGGTVLLRVKGEEAFRANLIFGEGFDMARQYRAGKGIIGHLARSEKGEIVNEVASDARYEPEDGVFSSLIGVPLKTKQQMIGLLVLVSRDIVMYTAGDLKLLTTLASQSAPAIDNALLHEKTLREAREREEQLKRQIEELRIELNEVRQEEKVTEIVETEYFKRLRDQSNDLRKIINGDA
jgi:transcriptional regulator with GAF, ATPase, and Fis domain